MVELHYQSRTLEMRVSWFYMSFRLALGVFIILKHLISLLVLFAEFILVRLRLIISLFEWLYFNQKLSSKWLSLSLSFLISHYNDGIYSWLKISVIAGGTWCQGIMTLERWPLLLLDSFNISLTYLRKYGQSLLYIFLVVTNLYLAALSQRPNLQIIPQHVAAILSKLGTVLAIMLENRGHLDALRI